jgi:hypothetical protein
MHYPRWSQAEAEFLEEMAGSYPLREIAARFHRRAAVEKWPVHRSMYAISQRLRRTGWHSEVRCGEWLTTGGAAELLGCPGTRVEAWLRRKRTTEILEPKWRGAFRYISRTSWRRLAKQQPQMLGGFTSDQLFALLEDRRLADAISERYPRPRGDWRIRCVETGQVWNSCIEAAAELHVSFSAISLAMRQGRPVRALGMTFEALREVAA